MSNVDMAEAVKMLAADKGITVETLLQVLADALVTAYKRRPDAADEAEVQIDAETMEIRVVAYDIDDDGNWTNPRDDTPQDMGRIAAQTFRQVLSQRIREAERDRKFEEYANREGDIVTGIIQQTDTRYTLLDLGKVEALLRRPSRCPTNVRPPVIGSRPTSSRSARRPRVPRSWSRALTRASSSGCSNSRSPRSPTGSSRSRPVPVSQAPHQDRGLVERQQRRSGRCLRRCLWCLACAWS
ncbi:MAG: NusA N-terminal domain-containing protein [Ilumatobacteraceae bacterium]